MAPPCPRHQDGTTKSIKTSISCSTEANTTWPARENLSPHVRPCLPHVSSRFPKPSRHIHKSATEEDFTLNP